MSRTKRTALFESAIAITSWKMRDYTRVYHYNGEHRASEKLPEDFLNRIDLHACDHQAGLIIDHIYANYRSESLTAFFNRHLGDANGHLVLKQKLLTELISLLRSFTILTKFQELHPSAGPIDFFPEDFSQEVFRLIPADSGLVPENFQIPVWYRRRLLVKASFKKWAYAALFLVYPYTLLLRMRWKPVARRQRTFRYGLHVFDSGLHHATPPYSLKFLNHKVRNHTDDILLIAEGLIRPVNRARLDEGNYACCYLEDLTKKVHVYTYIRRIVVSIAALQAQFIKQLPTGALAWLCATKLLKSIIAWDLFFRSYRVEEFVTFQEPGNIFRSLLQKKNRARTTFIFLNSSYDTLHKKKPDVLMDSVFGCMIYDRMLSSRVSIDYFRRNNNLIGHYTDVGIPPADHAFKIKHDPVLRLELKMELGIPDDKIVIGFFDVSMGREHMFTFAEALEMVAAMEQLLESDSRYFCIYKSRTTTHYLQQPEVKEAFEHFIKHDRVLFANTSRPDLTSTHFMGVSDLVIGCFASSVGMEAVSGGIPAFYYTPARFFREASIIKNIPNFCACGYDKLQELTEYWLHKCEKSEFCVFQERYVKPLIDSHCDGRAHERITQELTDRRTPRIIKMAGTSIL